MTRYIQILDSNMNSVSSSVWENFVDMIRKNHRKELHTLGWYTTLRCILKQEGATYSSSSGRVQFKTNGHYIAFMLQYS